MAESALFSPKRVAILRRSRNWQPRRRRVDFGFGGVGGVRARFRRVALRLCETRRV